MKIKNHWFQMAGGHPLTVLRVTTGITTKIWSWNQNHTIQNRIFMWVKKGFEKPAYIWLHDYIREINYQLFVFIIFLLWIQLQSSAPENLSMSHYNSKVAMELQLKTERMLEAKRQSEGQKSPMRNKSPLCGKSPTRR